MYLVDTPQNIGLSKTSLAFAQNLTGTLSTTSSDDIGVLGRAFPCFVSIIQPVM